MITSKRIIHLFGVSCIFLIITFCTPLNKKKSSKRGILTWVHSKKKGFLTLNEVNRLMKNNTDVFKEEGGIHSKNGKDTVGYFIRKENALWIILTNYSDNLAVRYVCCKRIKNNNYAIVKTGLDSEIFGECPFIWEKYLQIAGPYMILEQLSTGSGYCGNFPRIFKLDGTEINTNDLDFTYWGCDESSVDSHFERTDVTFKFDDNYFQTYHSVEVMRESDRMIEKRITYRVRYILDGLNLLTKDTIGVNEIVYSGE